MISWISDLNHETAKFLCGESFLLKRISALSSNIVITVKLIWVINIYLGMALFKISCLNLEIICQINILSCIKWNVFGDETFNLMMNIFGRSCYGFLTILESFLKARLKSLFYWCLSCSLNNMLRRVFLEFFKFWGKIIFRTTGYYISKKINLGLV